MRGQAALCAAQDKKAFFSGNPWECLIFFGTVEISTQIIYVIAAYAAYLWNGCPFKGNLFVKVRDSIRAALSWLE